MKILAEDFHELNYMSSKEFDKETGLRLLQDKIVDQRRWVTTHRYVFEHEDGSIWGFYWDVGSTESQENEELDEYIDLIPFQKKEVLKIEYAEK